MTPPPPDRDRYSREIELYGWNFYERRSSSRYLSVTLSPGLPVTYLVESPNPEYTQVYRVSLFTPTGITLTAFFPDSNAFLLLEFIQKKI